jgi:signal transduction histidine kinase
MQSKTPLIKAGLITGLVLVITALHVATGQENQRVHIIYRELYFLPLILAGFWYGLRGALVTSLTVTAFYLPYTVYHWQAFSPDDLDSLLEILLFNVVAAGVGFLRDREQTRQREKRKAIAAMAGAVAHEMNTPLFAALGTAQLLQEDFEEGTGPHTDLAQIIASLQQVKDLVRQIASIENVVVKSYVGREEIMDIGKSAPFGT